MHLFCLIDSFDLCSYISCSIGVFFDEKGHLGEFHAILVDSFLTSLNDLFIFLVLSLISYNHVFLFRLLVIFSRRRPSSSCSYKGYFSARNDFCMTF